MSTEIAPGGGTNIDARAETPPCADDTFREARERADSPRTPLLISRKALIAKLEREQYETVAGYTDVELAKRNGWNARARELIGWLRGNRTGSHDDPSPDVAAAFAFDGEGG